MHAPRYPRGTHRAQQRAHRARWRDAARRAGFHRASREDVTGDSTGRADLGSPRVGGGAGDRPCTKGIPPMTRCNDCSDGGTGKDRAVRQYLPCVACAALLDDIRKARAFDRHAPLGEQRGRKEKAEQ